MRTLGLGAYLQATVVRGRKPHEQLPTILSGQAAAWLAWKHREQLHRAGAVDLRIPKRVPDPPWLQVALGTLAQRRGWAVARRVTPFERVYRLTWQGWRGHRAANDRSN